jgi:hypothetical protein
VTIKLIYGPTPKYPTSKVMTVDERLEAVAGLLESDLDLPYIARQFAKRLREVIGETIPPFSGAGNAYYHDVGVSESHVGLDVDEPPKTISVPTTDLLEAVEEWADHLEKTKKWPEWALKGPSAK